jgi:hypothetical protein
MSTSIGLYKASIGGLADEKRWSRKRYQQAFDEAAEAGFVKYDDKALLIYIPNFIKYHPPASANVVISWGKVLQELPNSEFKKLCVAEIRKVCEGMGDAFVKAFKDAIEIQYSVFSINISSKEDVHLRNAPPSNNSPKKQNKKKKDEELEEDITETMKSWNFWAKKGGDVGRPVIPEIKRMSQGRRKKLITRLKNPHFREYGETAMIALNNSPFHRGENDREWVATFDWFIKNDENYLKLLEKAGGDG